LQCIFIHRGRGAGGEGAAGSLRPVVDGVDAACSAYAYTEGGGKPPQAASERASERESVRERERVETGKEEREGKEERVGEGDGGERQGGGGEREGGREGGEKYTQTQTHTHTHTYAYPFHSHMGVSRAARGRGLGNAGARRGHRAAGRRAGSGMIIGSYFSLFSSWIVCFIIWNVMYQDCMHVSWTSCRWAPGRIRHIILLILHNMLCYIILHGM
jgi:hypothetical protein